MYENPHFLVRRSCCFSVKAVARILDEFSGICRAEGRLKSHQPEASEVQATV